MVTASLYTGRERRVLALIEQPVRVDESQIVPVSGGLILFVAVISFPNRAVPVEIPCWL